MRSVVYGCTRFHFLRLNLIPFLFLVFLVNVKIHLDIYRYKWGDNMAEEITIKKKSARRGDDGHKVVSVRMRDELIARLDALAETANRSRNEIINLLLESAVDIVNIEGEE